MQPGVGRDVRAGTCVGDLTDGVRPSGGDGCPGLTTLYVVLTVVMTEREVARQGDEDNGC